MLEPDFFQYLSERPLGDGLFYCYRWFLVSFKRGLTLAREFWRRCHYDVMVLICAEFVYNDVFRMWETWWAARDCSSAHFLEFCGLSIMTQFKSVDIDEHYNRYCMYTHILKY